MLSFCEYLYNKGAVNTQNYKILREFAANHSLRKIIKFIREEKFITEDDLLKLSSSYFQIELYSKLDLKLNNGTAEYFDLEEIDKFKIIVLIKEKNKLLLGSLYPPDLFLKEKLKYKFNLKPEFCLMTAKEFKECRNKIYNNYFKLDQNEILRELPELKNYDSRDVDSLKNIVEDAPVVKLLNKILTEAISLSASDIHLEQKKRIFKIRYRIDGILKTYYRLPLRIAAAVISRIKIISGMDITVRHLPQDGKLEFEFQNQNYDIRSSVIPTIHGEKAVLRLLLRSDKLLTVEELNFSPQNLKRFKEILKFKSGIILLSGPTGSGKTTTLFSILNKLAAEKNNIITVENPVEYKLELLNQIEVNEAQGLKFPLVLRSILRQDPDIIMIGEIRDKETAEIAIRAAVTGHLVLSTIHTIDSISAVYRLLDMGIPPYLISSTLKAVISQRLLRKLCKKCRQKVSAEEFSILKSLEIEGSYQAAGCSECNEGYSGRTAAAEVLLINEKLKNLINLNSSREKLKNEAKAAGLLSLYKSALFKVEKGVTSLEELLRVIELKK